MFDQEVKAPEGSPFHKGELTAQTKTGAHTVKDWASALIRPYLPEQHQAFFTAQPFLIVSARDDGGRPWATLLSGEDGFTSSSDDKSLRLNSHPVKGDALAGRLSAGADIGVIGIELATRRRNRVNGIVSAVDEAGFSLAVTQSFGNCPKYIRERGWFRVAKKMEPIAKRYKVLSAIHQKWIGSTDTLFIASGHSAIAGGAGGGGMDASHRGGEPGFVKVIGCNRLVLPDYVGNNFFNTIGNLIEDPRAGLLFIDFETGSLLQVTGMVSIDWDSDEVAKYPEATRLLMMEISEINELTNATDLRWDETVAANRQFEVQRMQKSSEDTLSVSLVPADGGNLYSFKAGQSLSVTAQIAGPAAVVKRHYSVSSAPEDDLHRITVKREPGGVMSGYIHDQLKVGDLLSVGQPTGDFYLNSKSTPVTLISAGSGITPMMSMLRHLARDHVSRSLLFIHGGRNRKSHALSDEMDALIQENPNFERHIAYSDPLPEDQIGENYDSVGRLTADRLVSLWQGPNADYYLCGPEGFVGDVHAVLRKFGTPDSRIHIETFNLL